MASIDSWLFSVSVRSTYISGVHGLDDAAAAAATAAATAATAAHTLLYRTLLYNSCHVQLF